MTCLGLFGPVGGFLFCNIVHSEAGEGLPPYSSYSSNSPPSVEGALFQPEEETPPTTHHIYILLYIPRCVCQLQSAPRSSSGPTHSFVGSRTSAAVARPLLSQGERNDDDDDDVGEEPIWSRPPLAQRTSPPPIISPLGGRDLPLRRLGVAVHRCAVPGARRHQPGVLFAAAAAAAASAAARKQQVSLGAAVGLVTAPVQPNLQQLRRAHSPPPAHLVVLLLHHAIYELCVKIPRTRPRLIYIFCPCRGPLCCTGIIPALTGDMYRTTAVVAHGMRPTFCR